MQLRPLTIESKAEIEAVTTGFPPYSDFNFASLYSWDTRGETRYAIIDGYLVLRLNDYLDGSPFYTLIGNGPIREIAWHLLERAPLDGISDTLKLVPEEIGQILAGDPRFLVEHDPDHDDYILSTAALANLAGGRLARQREQRNRFVREHPNAKASTLDLGSQTTRAEILRLFELWATTGERSQGDVADERIALTRALADAESLGLAALGIATDAGLAAANVFEILPHPGFANGHYMKTDRRYAGIGALLVQAVAEHLAAAGVVHMNTEQDMGLLGLRTAKRQLAPVRFLRKYLVRRHGEDQNRVTPTP